MKKIFGLGAFALGAMVVLIFLEAGAEEEALSLTDFLLEFSEKLVLVGTMMISAYLILSLRQYREDQAALKSLLEVDLDKGALWRAEAQENLLPLAEAIEEQFQDWSLTKAESDIARLLLKGMSHKEIAKIRLTSEATIRQQARAVYRKSGVTGRAELSAYFLEDLFSVMTTVPRRRSFSAGFSSHTASAQAE